MTLTVRYLLPTREHVMEGRDEAAPLLELARRAEGLDGVWVAIRWWPSRGTTRTVLIEREANIQPLRLLAGRPTHAGTSPQYLHQGIRRGP